MTNSHISKSKHQDRGICLVEDDLIMGESLSQFFELEKLPCDWFRSLSSARNGLQQHNYCVLISDIRLPDGDGGDFYLDIIEQGSSLPPTLFITAHGAVEQAVSLLKQGARDYITKPFEPDELMVKLRRACPSLFERKSNQQGRHSLGVSQMMQRVEQLLERVAPHAVPVLITGESGVGKEYAARHLHNLRDSGDNRPFVALNCAALPHDLIESELFGSERGAFTGAVASRPGLFEQAQGGTLFLDEVGDMPLAMQAKLLRVVQEGQLRRIGGSTDISVNADLIWATNQDLEVMVEKGTFREDLYFRINTVHVILPPLRERPKDIIWFTQLFLDQFAQQNNCHYKLSPMAQEYLTQQRWAGNIRELKQAVERAAIFNESGILEPGSFAKPGQFEPFPELNSKHESEQNKKGLRNYLAECERWYLQQALEKCQGRIGDAALTLGISRKSLWERMNRYGIGRNKGDRCNLR